MQNAMDFYTALPVGGSESQPKNRTVEPSPNKTPDESRLIYQWNSKISKMVQNDSETISSDSPAALISTVRAVSFSLSVDAVLKTALGNNTGLTPLKHPIHNLQVVKQFTIMNQSCSG